MSGSGSLLRASALAITASPGFILIRAPPLDHVIPCHPLQISVMDAERQRQVAEKHASLESMVRAAAAATTEAAMKAEALKKLVGGTEGLC